MSHGLVNVHLNPRVKGLKPSATVAINERSDALIKEGKEVYKLGLGQSPFPVAEPVIKALQKYAHEKDYLAVKGLLELRECVANYFKQTQDIQFETENVLIGPGSKELMFLLQLAYGGDLVLPSPSWVSYEPQAHVIGRKVFWIQTEKENQWKIGASQLDAFCTENRSRNRILILNYPSNPTGVTYSIGELQELAVVAKKHKLILLSDEIYGETEYNGEHDSIARYYPEGTIISTGLSKWCGAGGWRLGVFLFPDQLSWLADAMAAVASETYTSTSAPIQYAAVTAFHGGAEIEEYLLQSRRVLKSLGGHITEKLRAHKVDVVPPQGGFYIFPDFSAWEKELRDQGIQTSMNLCERILNDTGVAFLPGSFFGRPEEELTARMAFVDFDGAKAISSAAQITEETQLNDAFLEENCGRVLKAIQLVCQWLSQFHKSP